MEYRVELLNEKDRDILRFHLEKDYDIDLNSEEQSEIKKLFYELISLSFKYEIKFNLDSENHDRDLFYDISKDYLKKLEEDIKTIRTQIPPELSDIQDDISDQKESR